MKRLQGRPSDKTSKKRPASALAAAPTAAMKSKSRCKAVQNPESIADQRTKIGGLFVSLSMRMGKNGHGNQILQLAEMKNSENKKYKIDLLKALVRKKINGESVQVDKYAHDCGCTLVDDLEGTLCRGVYLDAYHAKKHKCGLKTVTKDKFPDLNSQAAEQLWARLERLQNTLKNLSRGKYRMFLKKWCEWRNKYYADARVRADACRRLSRRKAMKRSAHKRQASHQNPNSRLPSCRR